MAIMATAASPFGIRGFVLKESTTVKRIGRHLRHSLVFLTVLLAVGPVMAQEEDADEELSDKLIEEVVVTSEFREVSVQDVPIAITAYTGDMMADRGWTRITEVTAKTPNVSLREGGQARSGMLAYIRGVGQSDFIAALEPGVGVYVNDVYYAQLTGSLLELLDVERVEILRGPQGTLSGRNSIGGAIKMFTREPDEDNPDYIRVGYGSYSQVDMRGAAGFTISENKLYGRFSGAAKTRDGYVKVLDYACTHPGSSVPTNRAAYNCKIGEMGDKEYATGRLELRWLVRDDLEVNFSADYLNDKSGTAPGVAWYADRTAIEAAQRPDGSYINPTVTLINEDGTVTYYRGNNYVPYGPYHNASDPINDPYVSYGTIADYGQQYVGAGDPAVTVPVDWKPTVLPSRNYIRQWGMSATVDWDINDDLSFLSITAYRAYHTWSTWDEDGSPVALNQLDNRLDNWQFTQEMRLLGTAGNVDWTLGGFYLDQESTYNARVTLNYALLDFLHGPDPTPAHTWALFAHANWHVTDRFNLIGGLRYSDEYKKYTHYRRNPDGSAIGSLGPTFPGAPDLINIRLTGVNGLTATFEDNRWDYRIAGEFTVNDDIMTYGSISTGYKSGGVNPRPFFPEQLKTFAPETSTAYELGVKSTWLDGTLQANAALFYTKFKDIQLILVECEVPSFIDPDGIGPPCLKPANVGDADIKGVELELMWYPTENVIIDAQASWLNFDYTYVDPLALLGSSIAPEDMITPYTPENKWSLGVQYTFPMTSHGSLTARVDAAHQGKMYADATNKPVNEIPAYSLYNFIAWWDSPDQDWRVEFQWLNFTDKFYIVDMYDVVGSQGTVLAQPGLPQTFNISFTRNF